jgi:hypothetical protein
MGMGEGEGTVWVCSRHGKPAAEMSGHTSGLNKVRIKLPGHFFFVAEST